MMTSSKFSRSNHSFSVPSVCKDKLTYAALAPPPPPGPPLPEGLVETEYAFHGVLAGYNYDYEGILQMPRTLSYKWNSIWPVPDDDVYCEMLFFYSTYNWFTTFWLNHPVGPTINFNSALQNYTPNGEFDTGPIAYTRPGWVGTGTGHITSVAE